jgi:hypothetical protein
METMMFMTSDVRFRRFFAPALIAFSVAGLGLGCGDDDDIDEPDVQTIRLVVGTGAAAVTYNIDLGTGLAAPIVITRTANPVVATFLRANGDVETLVSAAEFELRLDGLNPAIATFTRTGAFTGTLTGVAVGTDAVTVQLYHTIEAHPDFERSINLQVN